MVVRAPAAPAVPVAVPTRAAPVEEAARRLAVAAPDRVRKRSKVPARAAPARVAGPIPAAAVAGVVPQRGASKRTSRNTDDRNPTRSGIQYPSPRFRQRNAEAEPVAAPARPSLRKVRRGSNDAPVEKARRTRKAPTQRRRGLRTTEATEELRQLAGRGASRAVQELGRAAEAVNAGHERDAARILRPLRDAYPDAAAVRELLGLCHYRMGQYPAASA